MTSRLSASGLGASSSMITEFAQCNPSRPATLLVRVDENLHKSESESESEFLKLGSKTCIQLSARIPCRLSNLMADLMAAASLHFERASTTAQGSEK
jgi:hypothetical protein